MKGEAALHIFLDDSGEITDTNKPFYVWAGFSLDKNPKHLKKNLDDLFSSLPTGKSGELKGFEATFEQRKKVFQCLADWEGLRICYLVVDRETITANQSTFNNQTKSLLKAQSENYFLSKVVSRLAEPYSDKNKSMRVYIDGQTPERLVDVHNKKVKETKEMAEIRLHEYLTLRINYPKWNTQFYWTDFKVEYIPDKNHGLMQAADFVANFMNSYYTYFEGNNSIKKRQLQESSNKLELYDILRPKIYHKIYGLSNVSLL